MSLFKGVAEYYARYRPGYPPELIAQHPAERRDASRLLVYDRRSGAVRHRTFAELPDELHGELAVVNDTKVVPSRIPIASPRGEVLLLERLGDVRRQRRLARRLAVEADVPASLAEVLDELDRAVALAGLQAAGGTR